MSVLKDKLHKNLV